MKIRKAKKEDLGSVAKIYRIGSCKKPFNTKFTQSAALKEMKECFDYGPIYLIEDEGKTLGFIASHVVKSNKQVAFIDEFWIIDKFQNNGLGKELLDFIEKEYKKKGIKKMRLTTNKKAKSCGFYEKLNYKESDELMFYDKKL